MTLRTRHLHSTVMLRLTGPIKSEIFVPLEKCSLQPTCFGAPDLPRLRGNRFTNEF
uniref:Uncharacterized protein n=2 Tax=Picea TaxID=3328 RepID=A0A101M3W2_PICGL|nr:hypothetical protein ABT39_MTgene198 [Picea glauca]QHR92654.1 hypothetical protein Q903MT_gene6702 [Picea sitchensis]